MAEQQHPTTATAGRSVIGGNGKTLTERLAAVGAKPVMAVDERSEMPIAEILRNWLEGANEHYRRAGLELTTSYARNLLELEDQRHAYMRRVLEALTK